MSEEKRIETAAEMAERLCTEMGDLTRRFAGVFPVAIRADREAIAAKCDELAAAAQREAAEPDAQFTRFADWDGVDVAHMRRIARCEGQASAFRAVAAMLRGAT